MSQCSLAISDPYTTQGVKQRIWQKYTTLFGKSNCQTGV